MNHQHTRPRRSLIFMPGNKPDMFEKALAAGADIVCIDLEDAIAPHDKEVARTETLALFADYDPNDRPECIVRINCLRTPDGLADLLALTNADRCPPALMLPKVKSPDEIHVHEELLSGAHEDVRLHVIIETNEGLESCYDIARCSNRIDSLLFGGVDMAAELRVEPTWNELFYARSRIVHAAASAGVDMIDVPYLDLSDMNGLEQEAQACQRLGFTGKAAIHPKQIPTLNRCFSPTEEQIAMARRVIEEFEKQGTGLVLIDNKLIEKPVLRSMYRILAIAEKL
ncbi:CoA ester lyase [Chloroflexi bacterium TSY]|nr:CoA ester lyase [Chloroflexi bacterium TSY]